MLLQSWFPSTFGFWHNPGSWSLSVELFFYIAFPFIYTLISRFNKYQSILVYVALLFLSVIPGLLYNDYKVTDFAVTYTSPVYRSFEFSIGVLLGVNIKRISMQNLLACLMFFLISSSLFFYLYEFGNSRIGFVGHNAFIIPFTSMLIISLYNITHGVVYKIISSNIINYLGGISYSFYLMQLPVLLYSDSICAKQYFSTVSAIKSLIELGFITLMLSMLSYHLSEVKMSK